MLETPAHMEDNEPRSSLWSRWTEPSAALQDAVQREHAQLFTQTILAILMTTIICSVLYSLLLEGDARLDFGLRGLPAFAFLGFCYLIGRTKWYLVGVIVMTGGIVVSGSTVILLTNDETVVATMLVLGMLGIVNAGAFLPAWAIGLTGLGAVCNIALFSSFYTGVSKMSLFVIAAGMVVMTAVYCIRAQLYQVETVDRRWLATRQMRWLRTLKASFAMVRMPMCRISEDGYIDSANVALAQMFGVSIKEIVDSPLEAIAIPNAPMENPFDLSTLVSGKVARLNTRRKYRHENGQVLTARVSVGAVSYGTDEQLLVACLEDITPYMDALDNREERRKLLKRRFTERREMLSLVNREVRAPLMGVLGSVDIMMRSNLPQQQSEYLDIIRSSCNSLVEIVDEVIHKDAVEAPAESEMISVEVDLGGVIEEICKQEAPRAFEKGVELVSQISGDVPRLVWADSARLHQVVSALVEGAIAHADSGHVYCGVRALSKGALRAILEIEISHSLSGGLDPAFGAEFVDVAQPGFSTFGAEGRTLRRMVTALGGTIETAPTRGDMSSVNLTFDWAVGAKPGGNTYVSRRLKGIVWVVLEPHRVQEVAVEMLRDQGFDAHAVSVNALQDQLSSHGEHLLNVEALLIDVGLTMPDGTIVVDQVRERMRGRALHIVHVGTPVKAGELARAAALYGGNHILKPLSFTGLGAVMNRDFSPLELDAQEWGTPEPTDVTELTDDTNASRILLVEDDPVHRRILVRILGQLGIYVEAVADGRHAVELFVQREYDLVLMDCRLPNLDGFETTQKLRGIQQEQGTHQPIVAMSASAMESERQKCISAGMDAFLAKPISRDTLVQTLEHWLA